jgi:hypothetical protein
MSVIIHIATKNAYSQIGKKVKLALCLIDEAACHENMLEWRCSSTILDNST